MMRRETDFWLDRTLDLLPWLLAALLGGVALHLLTLLALPRLTPSSAYRRLALKTPVGQVALLPRAAPGTGPSFSDPFATLALCRFDLSLGPLRLRARADNDHPFSVSVRLADGTIIYSANDRQTPKGSFNILIVTQAQADASDLQRDNAGADENAAGDAGTVNEDELRLISPAKAGFALFRALSLRESDYDAAAAALASVECAVEKPAR
ncbi:hypothetical protein [uncultured Rhodoblastus sp.]|uniref:hypothetical protein n=1 Tax=uncultured Rhodoblastus sp. TaxID=543037 RepID=UPI0025D5F239|nr:hypothetical protein [uncultured Rhodoblastus sp.]